MNFSYTPELLEYMKQKKCENILVELVICDGSDLEISELHIQLADEKRAVFFRDKKGYGVVETAHGKVLLPKYKLEMDETVEFGLKKVLFVKLVTCKGIRA